MKDFYNAYDDLAVLPGDQKTYEKLLKDLEPEEKDLLKTKGNFYVVEFENIGGVVMPLILEIEHADGSRRSLRLPAEIWAKGDRIISKLLLSRQKIRSIEFDPRDELADLDHSNNRFPRLPAEKTFQLQNPKKEKNPKQRETKSLTKNEPGGVGGQLLS